MKAFEYARAQLLASRTLRRGLAGAAAAFAVGLTSASAQAAAPLKIGYSDWPGWVLFQVAIDKGWFKQENVDVDFEWFDYSASLDAFSAGKLDGVGATNGDALVTGASGAKNVMILLTDYSSGNDMLVAKPSAKTVEALKGKKVGVEVGLVDHLLLDTALAKHGMKESDVTLVNAKTNELPQVLASSQDIAAIGAWQPSAGEALKRVPGSRPIFTSADAPGLIYDAITVNPASLASRKADWAKVLKVWYRCVAYVNDPKTQADAVKIMSARVGLTPAQYLPLLKGTHLLDAAAAKKAFVKGDGLDSIYGSSANADKFNVRNAVYKQPQDVNAYIDPSLANAAQ
ncbi:MULTISPECIES: ABC transporter substrate-binding protein [unclassified Paraburkholderia]|jgi:NitT/TauT family transport system substrate-binding protein|uniref:ABC transporter substrate-binding protein n=1 Tax=unclassified Paraburkholderia TaxID=2615204 RepID=UPI0009477940|nr:MULTISPECIES: ABC transporter substrate-binding protein [unclassified Paraburkholderia]APR35459.1 ABC transporter substrate-binding protein [Paraburkholderia sp. SOS3]MDQ7979375.1 ABC transporter substrate-binding protein [Paraburkholderia sp. SARCC-3016]